MKEQINNLKNITIQIGNEEYIHILDLKKRINSSDSILLKDCIITPYYIHKDKRYELYQYEFLLDTNETSFERYILEKCGKCNIDEVDKNIIALRKICFDNDFVTAKENILKWIDFLINNKMICKEIEEIYGEFSLSNLFVAIY